MQRSTYICIIYMYIYYETGIKVAVITFALRIEPLCLCSHVICLHKKLRGYVLLVLLFVFQCIYRVMRSFESDHFTQEQ